MKTLVNKRNSQVKITAPDGMVKNRTNCWAIWSEGDRLMLLDKDNWTLVEEEPKKINFYQIVPQSYEEKVKMYMTTTKKELAEMMARRDCIEDALQQQRMFDISQEPVDLEKFTEKIKTFQGKYKHPEIVSIKGAMAFMARMFYQYPNVARQWYEQLPKATMD